MKFKYRHAEISTDKISEKILIYCIFLTFHEQHMNVNQYLTRNITIVSTGE